MKSLTKDELTPGLNVIVISPGFNLIDTVKHNNDDLLVVLKCIGLIRYIDKIFYADTKENRTFLLLDNKKIGGFDESQRPNRNRNTNQSKWNHEPFL